MSTGMQRFLDDLIESSEGNVAEIQIIFVPGTGVSAGGLMKVDGYEDLYEMVTFVAPTGVNEAKMRKEDLQTVSVYFESSAVQRVMREKKVETRLVTPASGMMPGGTH